MGLDAAFIVVSSRHKWSVQVRALRNEHEIHKVFTKGRDRDIPNEYPLECVVATHKGITNQVVTWNYWTHLTDDEIDKMWGNLLIMIDTNNFTVIEDEASRGRPELERLVLAVELIDWYYPGLGDTLVYAWSE